LIAQGNGIAFVTCQNEGATSTAQITVSMDDLLTVAEGDVLLPGGGRAPQFDVVLGSFGRTRTNSEGHFRIESVPTRFGRLRVQVSGAIAGAYYAGQSRELDPRPGAVTDFGLIEARPQAVENVIVSADSGDRVVRFLRPDGAEISRVTVDIPVQGVANDPMGSVWLVGGTKVMQVQREPFLVRASTTIAGASFNSVALSPDGHAWVTDQGRNRLIRLDASGAVVAEFDAPPTRIDPRGVAVLPLVNKNYFVYYTSYSPKSSFTGELTRVDPLGGPTISTVFPGDPVLSVAVTPQGTICVPVDSRGAGQDRVEVWDMGLRTRLNSLSIPHDWKQMRAVVVTPDSHIWVATAENFGRFLPAYLYHFDPAANRLVESLPLSSPQEPGVYPSGCWCDGEGKVWVSVSTVDRLFIHDRRTQASSTLPVGDAPVNQGDPSGYLMAHIIFPDRDFDGDGVNNRAELQAGTNPFVFNR
jgi:streptogramin lyase